MNNDYEPSKTAISASDQWIIDSRVNRYRLGGALFGALLALTMILNIDLQCRLLKNSQGCGFDTSGQAIGFSTLIVVVLASLAGSFGGEAAKQHLLLRRFTVCVGVLFFTLKFGWLGFSGWIVPQHQEDLWSKRMDWALAVVGLSYFVGLWYCSRKLNREQFTPQIKP